MFLSHFWGRSQALFLSTLLTSSLLFTSCGDEIDKDNPNIPGVYGPVLDATPTDGVRITMVFKNVNIQTGAQFPLPEYKNSHVFLGPNFDIGGTQLTLFVAYEDMFDNDRLKNLDPKALPDGRPIPGLSNGRLPAVAVSLPELMDIGLYMGDRVYGIWIPVDALNDSLPQNLVIPYKFWADGMKAGMISLVGPNTDGEGSGFFLALDLGSKAAKYLKKRWQRRR